MGRRDRSLSTFKPTETVKTTCLRNILTPALSSDFIGFAGDLLQKQRLSFEVPPFWFSDVSSLL